MFEKFTDGSRRVIVLAQQEAKSFGHPVIMTCHILAGLVGNDDDVAGQALARQAVTLEPVRFEIERIQSKSEPLTSGFIPFTPNSKRLLEAALRACLHLRHEHIGTGHLLLALIDNPDFSGTLVLERLDVNLKALHQATLDLLGAGGEILPHAVPPRRR